MASDDDERIYSGDILDDEPQNITLLDVIEDRKKQTEGSFIHRMNVIAKMLTKDYQQITAYYRKLVTELQDKFKGQLITGLLLLYPHVSVLVVEACQEIIQKFVYDFQKDVDSQSGLLSSAKILSITHDIPFRLYQKWSVSVLDIQAPNIDLFEPTESVEKMVIDLLLQLLKLGSHLGMKDDASLKTTLESLHDEMASYLPQQVIVTYLLEKTDDPCMMLPSEYIDYYSRPFDVRLAGELTWPMPIKLFPYN